MFLVSLHGVFFMGRRGRTVLLASLHGLFFMGTPAEARADDLPRGPVPRRAVQRS